MASAADIFEQLLSSSARPLKAPALWEQAARALSRMPVGIDPRTRDRVFDRFLDEQPILLYRTAHELKSEHRASLFEALGRCSDREAKLLLSSGAKAFAEAALLLRVLMNASTSSGVIASLAKAKSSPPAAVLAACVELVSAGYPPASNISFAGMFGAVMLFGTSAQVKMVLETEPPLHAVGWLRLASKVMPNDRAALIRKRTEGMPDPGYSDAFGPSNRPFSDASRYRRLEPQAATSNRSSTNNAPATASTSRALGEALLAAVYAAPEDDAPRAVYADWLLGNGDPFGELIQLQLARASGKKGTIAREKILFDAGKKSFWPDHPSTIANPFLQWQSLDRGFPSVVSLKGGTLTQTARTRLHDNPAWSTVRELDCSNEPAALEGVRLPPMPLLRTVHDVGLRPLSSLAKANLPIETLELALDALPAKVLRVSFERLKRLRVSCASATVSELVERLNIVGLTSRIADLEVWLDGDVPSALDVFSSLPENIQTFGVGSGIRVGRTARAPSLEIVVEKHSLDDLLDQLLVLAPARVSSVHVVLSASGYFTKKTHPLAEKRAREVVKRFAKGAVSAPTR
jgi:uncharacterized protein (TIGR02996 family)